MAKLKQSQIRKLIKEQYKKAMLKEANPIQSELDKTMKNDPSKSGYSIIKREVLQQSTQGPYASSGTSTSVYYIQQVTPSQVGATQVGRAAAIKFLQDLLIGNQYTEYELLQVVPTKIGPSSSNQQQPEVYKATVKQTNYYN